MLITTLISLRGLVISTALVLCIADQLMGSATIPEDRMTVAYELYSKLLPFGETARSDWPHDLLLIEDSTVNIVGPGQKCDDPEVELNPHVAVKPTSDRRRDFAEILQDFDRRCHERVTLDPARFKLSNNYRLLNAADKEEFETALSGPMPPSATAVKFKGARALFAFSPIYFNSRHTVALLYARDWCGNVCGHGFWLAFADENGTWKSLDWNSTFWIS